MFEGVFNTPSLLVPFKSKHNFNKLYKYRWYFMEYILFYIFCTFLIGFTFYDLFKEIEEDALAFSIMVGATWFLLPLHIKIYNKMKKEKND